MLADHSDGLSSSIFSLILDSSVGLSVVIQVIQSAGDPVPEFRIRNQGLWNRISYLAYFDYMANHKSANRHENKIFRTTLKMYRNTSLGH